ncbi:STAS domain-containing protein [Algoriphagus sediminis]|uniref:Anti-sigma factor antagonist n=1 Tax=Algoriphagus sediminis TaxID=3057113 RepID=A0ABT7YED4_9BACT|nr:STAS domain-containing protein [Algoriphagus sediminis]MDN3204891.1 STAS domain-containing protein [Algoriphagus sediminis]
MLKLKQISESPNHILRVQGEIDASNSVQLDEAMQEAIQTGTKSILVDCLGLEYISSAGLGVFMSYLEDFKEEGISFKIYGLSEKVFEVFKILGLDQLIPIFTDKEAALAS